MIDRDPITEPAGELVAAQTLVDLLQWVDTGGDERFNQLAETLLNWKGRRLRDAITDTARKRLLARVDALAPDAGQDALRRLAQAAGLALDGAALEAFVRRWLELAPENSAFRLARLRALTPLVELLPERKDRDLVDGARLLLQHRAVLGADTPDEAGVPHHLPPDFALADYLYQHFGRNEAVAAELRRWFVQHAEPPVGNRLRVIRTAAILGHTDVLEAYFAAGHPSSPGGNPSFAESARKLVVDRLADHHVEVLDRLAGHIKDHLARGTGDGAALLAWAREIVARAASRGPADGSWSAMAVLRGAREPIAKSKVDPALRDELLARLDEVDR